MNCKSARATDGHSRSREGVQEVGDGAFPDFSDLEDSILLKFVSYDFMSPLKKLAQFYFKMQKSSLKWIP